MIELSEKDIRAENRKSSKGNQLKWMHGDIWYKADYAGYEGLAEYVVSQLLLYSNLERREFVVYQTEEIRYKRQILKGCSSGNFLTEGEQLTVFDAIQEGIRQDRCCSGSLSQSVDAPCDDRDCGRSRRRVAFMDRGLAFPEDKEKLQNE